MTRRVVRRSETNLGSFMLPALATLVAPYAVAEWEFVELHKPIADVNPGTAPHAYVCFGCGGYFGRAEPLDVAIPLCEQCRDAEPAPGARS